MLRPNNTHNSAFRCGEESVKLLFGKLRDVFSKNAQN